MEHKDSEGSILSLGDRIELTINYSSPNWMRGAQGTIVCFNGSDIGIEFDLPNTNGGHNLSGAITNPDRAQHGQWMHYTYLKRLQAPSIVTPEVESSLIEAAKKQITFMFLEGKAYSLTPAPLLTLDRLTDPIYRATGSQIATIRAQAAKDIANERARASSMLSMPSLTLELIKQGWAVFRDGNYVVFGIPIHYNPKYISNDYGKSYSYELLPLTIELLQRDVMFCPYYTKEFKYAGISRCYKKDFSGFFQHYHGGQENCTGAAKPPPLTSFDNLSPLAEFKTRYQKELEIINAASPLYREPLGLPSLSDLTISSYSKSYAPPPTSFSVKAIPPIPIDYFYDSLVEVLPGVDARLTGRIGKVYYLRSTAVDVAFLFEVPGLTFNISDPSLPGTFYTFRRDQLKLAPSGSARSRVPNSVDSTSVTSESITITSPPSPVEPIEFPDRLRYVTNARQPDGTPIAIDNDRLIPAIDYEGWELRVGDIIRYRPNINPETIAYGGTPSTTDNLVIEYISWHGYDDENHWKLEARWRSGERIGFVYELRAIDSILIDPIGRPQDDEDDEDDEEEDDDE